MKRRSLTRVDVLLMLGVAILLALLAYLGMLRTPSASGHGSAITWMPDQQ